MRDSEVALPAGVGRVGSDQRAAPVQRLLVGPARRGEVAGRARNIAYPIEADGKIALPLSVGRVGGCQPVAQR